MSPVELIPLMLGLLDRASQIGALIQTARSEGRDVTDAELDGLQAKDNAARSELEQAIAVARGEGR